MSAAGYPCACRSERDRRTANRALRRTALAAGLALTTPAGIDARPLAAAYDPGGGTGYALALVGSLLVALAGLCALRGRLGLSRLVDDARVWRACHGLVGALGMALLVMHTAFSCASVLGGLALGSGLVVLATGVIGALTHGRRLHSAAAMLFAVAGLGHLVAVHMY